MKLFLVHLLELLLLQSQLLFLHHLLVHFVHLFAWFLGLLLHHLNKVVGKVCIFKNIKFFSNLIKSFWQPLPLSDWLRVKSLKIDVIIIISCVGWLVFPTASWKTFNNFGCISLCAPAEQSLENHYNHTQSFFLFFLAYYIFQ